MSDNKPYQDREVVGLDRQGNVVQWHAGESKPFSTGQKLAEFGLHNLREQELDRVGADRQQWLAAKQAVGVAEDGKVVQSTEYYVWSDGSCDNKTADPAEALQWAGEFRSDGRDDVYIVDVDNNVIDETELGKLLPVLPGPTKEYPGSRVKSIPIELEHLPALGIACITSVGDSENIYIEKDGVHYFCKVGNIKRYAEGVWDFVAGRKLQGWNNIETQEWAKKVLTRYASDEKVSDLYDDDSQFANAIRDLAGPDFKYPDFSHLTVAEACKKAEAMGRNVVENEVGSSKRQLYAISGRIPGDDDDSLDLVVAEDEIAAQAAFRLSMTSDLSSRRIDHIQKEHGTACFVIECRLVGEYVAAGTLQLSPELVLREFVQAGQAPSQQSSPLSPVQAQRKNEA